MNMNKDLYHFPAILHDQHLVAVHNGVEPVGDGQHCAVMELGPDGRLDQRVRPANDQQNYRRTFINYLNERPHIPTGILHEKFHSL